jgi:hypothetical protein
MEGSPFLPLSEGLAIEQVTPSSDGLLVQVVSSSPTACCPLCGAQAWRIHSRYTRHAGNGSSPSPHNDSDAVQMPAPPVRPFLRSQNACDTFPKTLAPSEPVGEFMCLPSVHVFSV